jgi:hypothetical protein
MHHYTYYSYEEWGRGYIGKRTCDCLPEEDVGYFGSFSDKTFKPTRKIIFRSDYANALELVKDEIILHDFYDVAKNPHFANRAKQTSTKFDTTGMTMTCTEETREKLRQRHLGKTLSKEHRKKLSLAKKGKKRKPHLEDTKEKIRQAKLGHEVSPETREKIRQTKLGTKTKPCSEETKAKIGNANRGHGRPWSEKRWEAFREKRRKEKGVETP